MKHLLLLALMIISLNAYSQVDTIRIKVQGGSGGGSTDTTSLSNRINLKQNLISLTTTGTSGAATFNQSTGALNIPANAVSDSILSYSKNAQQDSTVILFQSGRRLAARDSAVGFKFSNGLLGTGAITIVGNTLTINPNITWRINNIDYTKNTPSVFTISNATAGYQRRDLIYADNAGALTKLQGTEDTVNITAPALPNNTVEVVIVDIFGSVITAGPFILSIILPLTALL